MQAEESINCEKYTCHVKRALAIPVLRATLWTSHSRCCTISRCHFPAFHQLWAVTPKGCWVLQGSSSTYLPHRISPCILGPSLIFMTIISSTPQQTTILACHWQLLGALADNICTERFFWKENDTDAFLRSNYEQCSDKASAAVTFTSRYSSAARTGWSLMWAHTHSQGQPNKRADIPTARLSCAGIAARHRHNIQTWAEIPARLGFSETVNPAYSLFFWGELLWSSRVCILTHTHTEAAKAFPGTTLRERRSSLLKVDHVEGSKQKSQREETDACCCLTVWIWQQFAGRELTVQLLSHYP